MHSNGDRLPLQACDGVRTFVGARSTSADATFSDYGEDCSHNGFPSPLGTVLPGYSVINWTSVNTGEMPCLTLSPMDLSLSQRTS